jgi:hypothetical protein
MLMKRYLTIVLLVLLLGGVLGYFFFVFWKKNQSRPLEDALLQNTSFYLSTKDALAVFPSFRNMPYGDDVFALPVFNRLDQQLTAFDSVLRATGHTLSGIPLIASLYSTGADKYDWLFLVDGSKTEAEELLGKLSSIAGAKVSKRIYHDETVLDILMPGALAPFSCASLNGIFMGSFSAFLVEEGIVQLRDNDPIEETDHRYRKIKNLAGNGASLTLFYNPALAYALEKQFIDESKSSLLAQLGSSSSWMALDVSFRNNSILLGGYTLPDSTGVLSTFNQAPKYEFGFDKVLPINTAYFTAQELVFDLENGESSVTSYLSNDWLIPFACYGLLEPLDNDFNAEWFLTMPVVDEDIANQSLQEMARFNLSDSLFTDELNGAVIGQLTNDSVLVRALGLSKWLPLSNPYFTVYKGHAFFANDVNTIRDILGKVNAGLVLAGNPTYLGFAQEVSSTNSLYIYANPTRMGELMPAILLNSVLEGKGSDYKNFTPVGLQYSYDEGVFFTIAMLQYRAGASSLATDEMDTISDGLASDILAWRLPLGAQVIGKPQLVTNHNTGELEVFVQDANNNIYLINRAGKVLWKKAIDGAIMGDVYQVDLYKNNKLQLIFNTQQKVYLFDRNGEYVEQFPVALTAKAVNGMFLMGDKQNFQYFVACEDYKVYGYTANGKPLQGWNPKPRVGTITYPLQFTTSQGKEYLILTNKDGTLLFYNRNGDRIEKPIRLEAEFNQPFFVYEHNKTFSLVNASSERILFSVNAKGEVKEITDEKMPPYLYFAGAVVDSSLQYFFVAADMVTFTSPELVTLNTFAPTQPIDQPIQLFASGSKRNLLGLTSTAGNQVYLVDMAGQLLPGLPLKGNTAMALGHLFDSDKLTLIVGDADGNLNAYRLP